MPYRLLWAVSFLMVLSLGTKGEEQSSEDWLLTLDIPGTGKVETVFNFRLADTTFEAYSKGEQASSIFGFWKYGVTRIFSDKFKSGSIAFIVDGSLQQKDAVRELKGVLNTPLGNRYFRARMTADTVTGTLLNGNKDTTGQLWGKPFEGQLPLRNYHRLTKEALDTIHRYLYKPGKLQADDYRDFEEDLLEESRELQDDLGMLLAFAYLSQDLPFSHLGLTRKSAKEKNRQGQTPTGLTRLKPLSDSTVKMTILAFTGSGDEINKAFKKVKAGNYENLVVDIRFNRGGGIEAGMAFIRHLMQRKRYGGIFLTQNYFRQHDTVPLPSAYQQFPKLTQGNYGKLMNGIHNYQGMCLEVQPVAEPYNGNVYVLTSSRTASTCEPIVYGLQQYNRAEIVGERTAGAMLSSEAFDLSNQFKVFIPTATYYTADGNEIDQNGVKPDHNVEPGNAVNYVVKELINSENRNP